MAYKIVYTPEYVKKDLSSVKLRFLSAVMMILGIAVFAGLVWYNREYVLYVADAFDCMAMQLQEGNAIQDAVAAFYETLQGGFGG